MFDRPFVDPTEQAHCSWRTATPGGPVVSGRGGGGVAPIYDLYAVSNHFGRMGFGHYTAFCRDLDYQNGKYWYTLDDSRVRVMPGEDVCSAAGYVLFYKLRRQ